MIEAGIPPSRGRMTGRALSAVMVGRLVGAVAALAVGLAGMAEADVTGPTGRAAVAG